MREVECTRKPTVELRERKFFKAPGVNVLRVFNTLSKRLFLFFSSYGFSTTIATSDGLDCLKQWHGMPLTCNVIRDLSFPHEWLYISRCSGLWYGVGCESFGGIYCLHFRGRIYTLKFCLLHGVIRYKLILCGVYVSVHLTRRLDKTALKYHIQHCSEVL
jgi:hypothetical protein